MSWKTQFHIKKTVAETNWHYKNGYICFYLNIIDKTVILIYVVNNISIFGL